VVPADDPMDVSLTVDQEIPITHLFGRKTPAEKTGHVNEVSIHISDDRKLATASVGHAALERFMSCDIFAVDSTLHKHSREWKILIGAFGEHTIKIERKKASSKVATLSVDDSVLVECSGEDLGCEADKWNCEFRFTGERCIIFDVPETNKDVQLLPTRRPVPQEKRYTHACEVSFTVGEKSMEDAQLLVGTRFFAELPPRPTERQEAPYEGSIESLANYGIEVPYAIDEEAATGLGALAAKGKERCTIS